ncbi:hypothetical protein [Paraburkholderia domus]|uniref:hypothetical protein n=1 Tax=Paraburkholderia domus TaxID=2793075 RepID=UPI0019119839|nr:hypothetical protein [Paraburkholderia domus]MBK5061765.1 hypothetical protein [Burkholderia sp. R-70199]CAE6900049.1 hypothetical protein R70199_03641 [Paraburkholderia domus]
MSEKQTSDEAVARIRYFLEAWEFNGVGSTIKTVQDSPGTHVALTVADLRELLAEIDGGREAFAVVVNDKAELQAKLAHSERNHRNTLDLVAQWGDLLRELKFARPLMLYGDEWITRIKRALCEIA